MVRGGNIRRGLDRLSIYPGGEGVSSVGGGD